MRWAALAGSALVLATGCAAPVDAEQAPAFADGIVTSAEYRVAVDGFVSCMRAAGFDSTTPVVSPIDGVTLLYDVIPNGDTTAWNDAISRCGEGQLSRIEPAYVESQDHRMVTPLRLAVVDCITSKGFKTIGDEQNATDFVATTGGQVRPVMECVVDKARELFPELPSDIKVPY